MYLEKPSYSYSDHVISKIFWHLAKAVRIRHPHRRGVAHLGFQRTFVIKSLIFKEHLWANLPSDLDDFLYV